MAVSEADSTAAAWAALAGGLPTHQDEIMASHPGRPTPAEAVAAGVTPASGEGRGPWPRPVIQVELHAFVPPDLPDPGHLERIARQGEIARLHRGERTLQEILADASRRMDEEDAELERRRDPIRYVTARRPRRNLLARLLGGRHAV